MIDKATSVDKNACVLPVDLYDAFVSHTAWVVAIDGVDKLP